MRFHSPPIQMVLKDKLARWLSAGRVSSPNGALSLRLIVRRKPIAARGVRAGDLLRSVLECRTRFYCR